MPKRDITLPKGYNPRTQAKVALFAAQLDDQLKRLKNNTKGLTVKQLEWQKRKGMNTIGMLLAHLALVEVWWINLAPNGISWDEEGKKMMQKITSLQDDGLPLKPNGVHPSYLKGMSHEKYMKAIAKARRSIHREMKTWHDRDLKKKFMLGKKWEFSRTWVLYHVLEHFAQHFGQILMIKHMMRDAGVLKPE